MLVRMERENLLLDEHVSQFISVTHAPFDGDPVGHRFASGFLLAFDVPAPLLLDVLNISHSYLGASDCPGPVHVSPDSAKAHQAWVGQQLILGDSRRKLSVCLAIRNENLDGRNQLQEVRHSLRPLVTHAHNLEIDHSFPSFLSRRFASMQRPSLIVLCFFSPLGGKVTGPMSRASHMILKSIELRGRTRT